MKFKFTCLAFLGLLTHTAIAAEKPNIVFILVDNVGWGAFGVYGGTTATPRIDKLASEGIRFNNYNVEAQCTPTRSAILTGRYSVRSGTYTVPLPGRGWPGWRRGNTPLPNSSPTSGYATALYGKWHLGNTQGRLPNDQGFDEWWGIEELMGRGGLYRMAAVQGERPAGADDLGRKEGRAIETGDASRPQRAADRGREVHHPEDGRVHQAQRSGEKAVLCLRRLLRGALPPIIANPNFAGKSTAARWSVSPTSSPRWIFASVRSLTPSRRRVSRTTPWSSSAATTRAAGLIPQAGRRFERAVARRFL